MKNKSTNKKPRLLIIGCGDVGMRLLPLLTPVFRVFALARYAEPGEPGDREAIRAMGAIPLQADLDDIATLRRWRGLAKFIVHLAPPASVGEFDQRTRNLVAILPHRARLVYVSTSGVYGDCAGAWVSETRRVAPRNPRAQRRVDAEQVLRAWARRSQAHLTILRVPGIYADNRLPIERLHKQTPALVKADDVWTNHIHADDLARIIVQALWYGKPNRVVHAVDDSQIKMADYFDVVADHFALPRPPRLGRADLQQAVSPMLWSFMSESRRLRNERMKRELRVRLRYLDVQSCLAAIL
jgi:nucleoside-diphosphate-sugar epimerase